MAEATKNEKSPPFPLAVPIGALVAAALIVILGATAYSFYSKYSSIGQRTVIKAAAVPPDEESSFRVGARFHLGYLDASITSASGVAEPIKVVMVMRTRSNEVSKIPLPENGTIAVSPRGTKSLSVAPPPEAPFAQLDTLIITIIHDTTRGVVAESHCFEQAPDTSLRSAKPNLKLLPQLDLIEARAGAGIHCL